MYRQPADRCAGPGLDVPDESPLRVATALMPSARWDTAGASFHGMRMERAWADENSSAAFALVAFVAVEETRSIWARGLLPRSTQYFTRQRAFTSLVRERGHSLAAPGRAHPTGWRVGCGDCS